MTAVLPDPQVLLSCHHEIGDSADISTESSHQWRFLRIAISQFNEIRFYSLAVYIHREEGDVDKGSIGLGDQVNTVCQFWVGFLE